jgi:glycosyltransferase involved in cell wall biosynthesis
VTGYLIPPGDSKALGSAILRILGDRLTAQKVGAAGRQSVIANYSWSMVAEQLGGIFEAVVGSDGIPAN